MEQKELRQWEAKCVQEEPAQCVAACPLHVDAKGFLALMAQRRYDKAWKILAKTLPLPSILARLCHGSCQQFCIRKHRGGAIEMASLEAYCAEHAKMVAPPVALPAKNKKVAILGAGFAGLCAAWELCRRGFAVTVYPARDCLDALGELKVASQECLRELENLKQLGVTFAEQDRVQQLPTGYDAYLIDTAELPQLSESFGESDEISFGTDQLGVFLLPAEQQPLFQATAARRGTNSVERYCQGVSLVAGREKEGAYPTKLYTNISEVENEPPQISNAQSCSEQEVVAEAKRCLQCECMECVKSCEFLRHFKYYPKIYARQIYNNDAIVMGTRQANGMVNSCMLCGLCEKICPENFSMADFCLQARQGMVEKDKMPPSAHEFALRDMEFSMGDKAMLAQAAPGDESCEYLYFPGCQLTASDPEGVELAYGHLRQKLGSVGLYLSCCGAPAQWSGRRELFEQIIFEISRQWQRLGSPKLIVSCPTCEKMLREALVDAEIISHWTILRVIGLPDGATNTAQTLAINDPCASRDQARTQESVRFLLAEMNIDGVEPPLSREHTQCCGYGGLLADANPPLARAVAKRRGALVAEDYVTYCAMCRDMLAKNGKRALHIFDLLFPRNDDPAARTSPGYSQRRENRRQLREKLLVELWHSKLVANEAEHRQIKIELTPEAAEVVEDRRILQSDIQKVLLHYQRSNEAFIQSENGHLLSCYRPNIVTYWVEFSKEDEGYLIYNAWSHRMRIRGGKS